MKQFFVRNKYPLLLTAIFVLAECLVQPVGEFPLNDDWSYAKSIKIWLSEGRYTIGNWGYMTLATHLTWGLLFSKVAGFSFFVLRLSTMVSALTGALFLYKLVYHVTRNPIFSSISALSLLFNPIYFGLSNTYMTDVNFTTLLILATFFAMHFFESGKWVYLFFIALISFALVLLRQFGILFPLCFTLAAFTSNKRWLYVAYGIGLTLLVYLVFKGYEAYLKTILPPYAGYKFSTGLPMGPFEMLDLMGYNFGRRYKSMVLSMLVYASPIALLILPSALSGLKPMRRILTLAVSAYFTQLLTADTQFFTGNIFENMILGPDTFYENSQPSFRHNYSPSFTWVTKILVFACSTASISTFLFYVGRKIHLGIDFKATHPLFVLSVSLIMGYAAMLLVVPSYFDRYHLPMITFAIILFAPLNRFFKLNTSFAVALLVIFFYTSVAGTHDYFAWNRMRWQAYEELKAEEKAKPEKINGGFEVNCWDEGHETWWTNYLDLNKFNYLIQYGNHRDFQTVKRYTFCRWFPFKQDTLSSFKRIRPIQTSFK